MNPQVGYNYNNQMGYNVNNQAMGAPQYNNNINFIGNNQNNFGGYQQQPNMNQNQYKKDLLDDLF